jgi:hypothetical protein
LMIQSVMPQRLIPQNHSFRWIMCHGLAGVVAGKDGASGSKEIVRAGARA